MAGRSELCNAWIGTSFAAKHWLSLDVAGLLCVSLSCSVHLYAMIAMYLFVISHSTIMVQWLIYFVLYLPFALLALSSLFMAWSTDPGAVPMGAKPLTTFKRQVSTNSSNSASADDKDSATVKITQTSARGERRCHKCMDNYKPPRAHHDSVTGRCIVKFDHYCPWVGNAVGALNHKFFVLFIGYTCCTTLTSLILLVTRFVTCSFVESSSDEANEERDGSGSSSSSTDASSRFLEDAFEPRDECAVFEDGHVFILILLVVSVVFFIFTLCMLLDQLDAISENTSKIARMKQRVGKAGTELSRVTHDFNEMFGGSSPHPTWHWFLPLSVKFQPTKMKSVILGYEEPTLDDLVHDAENPAPLKTEDIDDDDQEDEELVSSSQHSSLLGSEQLETEMALVENTRDSSSLMAAATDEVHLGGSKLKSKQGMFQRRSSDNPKFVDGTNEFS